VFGINHHFNYSMYKHFFNTIAYRYYAKNTYEFDVDFLEKEETKRFIYLCHNKSLDKFVELERLLAIEFSDYSVSEVVVGSNFPSYFIQINKPNDYEECMTVYISHLVPYYHLTYAKKGVLEVITNPLDEVLKKRIKSIITFLFKYEEFPNEILFDTIPDIKLDENFTYFNAFFSDNYRMIV